MPAGSEDHVTESPHSDWRPTRSVRQRLLRPWPSSLTDRRNGSPRLSRLSQTSSTWPR